MDNLSEYEASKYLKDIEKKAQEIRVKLKDANFGDPTRKNRGLGEALEELHEALGTDDYIWAKTAIFNLIGICQTRRLSEVQINRITGIPLAYVRKFQRDYKDWRAGVQSDQMRALEEFDQAIAEINEGLVQLNELKDFAINALYKMQEDQSITGNQYGLLVRLVKTTKTITEIHQIKQEMYNRQGLNDNLHKHFNKGTKSKHEAEADETVEAALGVAKEFETKDMGVLRRRIMEQRGENYFDYLDQKDSNINKGDENKE